MPEHRKFRLTIDVDQIFVGEGETKATSIARSLSLLAIGMANADFDERVPDQTIYDQTANDVGRWSVDPRE